MVITPAAKEKASVFLKGESSVQRHRAPTEAQGQPTAAQMSPPPGRGEQPCQSPGCPGEELGDKLMVCHPNRASTQRSQGGGSLEGALLEAEKLETSQNTTAYYTDICQAARKKVHAHL